VEGIDIGIEAPTLSNPRFTQQGHARFVLKLIERSEVRVEDGTMLRVRVEQESTITEIAGVFPTTPEPFPWESLRHMY
jgi:hypothetical protein